MSTVNTWGNPAGTVGTLNGLFKETYADKLQELIPDGVKLLNRIKFQSKDKQPGNLFHQPIILGMEHGITFAASDDDAFNLNPAVSGVIKDAQVKGNPKVMRSLLGYVASSRAAQAAFVAFSWLKIRIPVRLSVIQHIPGITMGEVDDLSRFKPTNLPSALDYSARLKHRAVDELFQLCDPSLSTDQLCPTLSVVCRIIELTRSVLCLNS